MKYLPIILVGLLISPSISFAAAFNSNLYYGSTGQDVSALQEFLTDQGVYSGPITGNFYSLTLAAVKRFQTANNISPISGYFGILSRGVANTILEPIAPVEETGTTTAPVVIPSPIVQSTEPASVQPTFGSTVPISPTPDLTPTTCDSTPAITVIVDTPSINLETAPSTFYVNAYANVVDGCGKLYPYNVYAGDQPRRTGMNTTGTTSIAISGANISYWEITGNSDVAAGRHSATYPYPITVSTGSATSTTYVQVQ